MRYILYVFLLAFSLLGFAQKKDRDTSSFIIQPNRIEFQMEDFNTNFQLVGGEESGILAVVSTQKNNGEGFDWVFHSLDTALTVRWTRVFSISFDSYLLGTEYHNGKYYLLFNTSRYRNEDLLLFELDAESAEFTRAEISTVFPVQLKFFEVLGNSVILSGYTNYRPVLLTYDLIEQKPRVVPGFYENNSDILDVIIDDESLLFTVIQQDKVNKNQITIQAKTFTSQGDLIQANSVVPGERKSLIDGTATMFLGGFQYMAGTFSKKPSEYSKGLYLAKFINGRQQYISYYDYAELTNFFGYMSDRREKRVLERIQRRRSKGKKANFSYRLTVHDILQRGDEYLMIAEAYYPRYSNSSFGYAGSGGAFANPGFLGYQYTHAIMVAFDRNGNILWDNSFAINDISTFTLREFVSVNTIDDKVVLMYLDENTIKTKIVQGREVYAGTTFNPVRLSYADDEIRSRDPEIEGLQNWYDNTLYAFGEQRIFNGNFQGAKGSRRVFYINKIKCNIAEE
ncbi:MAG: hypothetical protein JXR10_05810 [Cyclobacteriaceae bacterium]